MKIELSSKIQKHHFNELKKISEFISTENKISVDMVVNIDDDIHLSQKNNYLYSFHVEFNKNMKEKEKNNLIKEIGEKLALDKSMGLIINSEENGTKITSINILPDLIKNNEFKPTGKLNISILKINPIRYEMKKLCSALQIDFSEQKSLKKILENG